MPSSSCTTNLLPKLTIKQKVGSVALHPVCSVTKMGIGGKLEAMARACSDEVIVPLDAGCCGFAGDRGFLVPELTRVGHAAGGHARSRAKPSGGVLLQQPYLRDRHDPRDRADLPFVFVFAGEGDAIRTAGAVSEDQRGECGLPDRVDMTRQT